jgi:2-oxoglutarate ferredoxin oxidoreductase subunit delta
MNNKVVVKNDFCKGCGLCIEYCPKKVLQVSSHLNEMGYHYAEADETKKCSGCLVCTLVCPEVAIEVYHD